MYVVEVSHFNFCACRALPAGEPARGFLVSKAVTKGGGAAGHLPYGRGLSEFLGAGLLPLALPSLLLVLSSAGF